MRIETDLARVQLKRCTKCKIEKSITCFSVDRRKSSGFCVRCKDCRRIAYLHKKDEVAETSRRHYLANKERHDSLSLAYYHANKATRAAKMAEWYKANKDSVAERVTAYIVGNPGCRAAWRARRRAAEKMATPPWADLEAIKLIYEEAARISLKIGIVHHVDHIIPITSRLVCGLHVETNLQILPGEENVSKSNKFEPYVENSVEGTWQRVFINEPSQPDPSSRTGAILPLVPGVRRDAPAAG